jgi:RNA polymerase sigma factor (sigma-70 family)
MKNSFINMYRTEAIDSKEFEYDEDRFDYNTPYRPLNHPKDQRDKLLDDLFEDEIARCLESLPGIYRSLVLLSDLEEFRYAEIARMVSCPVGTVRSRLHTSRRVLQKKLLSYVRANGYVAREFGDGYAIKKSQ